jgi:hypothetical protein
MADGDLQKFWFDYEGKAINYLLVANSAGFAGCLATLKDYATVPQLKGIGALIGIFGSGLIAAGIAFVIFQWTCVEMLHVTGQSQSAKPKTLLWLGRLQNLVMLVSTALFLNAIIVIMNQLKSL